MSNMNMSDQTARMAGANMENAVVQSTKSEVQRKPANSIPKPTPAYLATTREIDISNLSYGSLHDFITDGTFTVNFSTPLEKRGPVPLGWSTWSSPPYSESANPDVLVSGEETTLTMDLSAPVSTFGFELEPNQFETLTYTADFYRGSTLVDSITRDINGNAGARLLARSGDLINRVVVSGPDSFAIAHVRLQQIVQEQNKTLLIFSALLALLVVTPLIL